MDVWQAAQPRQESSEMFRYLEYIRKRTHHQVQTIEDLQNWAITDESFWATLSDFMEIIWKLPPNQTWAAWKENPRQRRWFPNAELNFAQNLLGKKTAKLAISAFSDGGKVRCRMNRADLHQNVHTLAARLKQEGLNPGDRVFGVLCNTAEAIVCMLACAKLGATWSSCSPDFGQAGIEARLIPLQPKIVFYVENYAYGGKKFLVSEKVKAATQQLPSCILFGLEELFSLNNEILSIAESNCDRPEFPGFGFEHPLYIMFSSGTTGPPKCIVHGAGGTLLQHKKELSLHCDFQTQDKILFYTTCGWMMWNWMVSALALDGELLLYEGSLVYPDYLRFWHVVSDEGVTILGISPKYISMCIKQQISPNQNFDFTSLKTVLATGSPLLPEHYEWLYTNVKGDIHIASISGGTDIISCFVLGNPLLPVHRGFIQGPGLGMAVDCFNEDGDAVRNNDGELVCTKPFPSMPLGFLNDPNYERFRQAYFNKDAEGIWHHGDLILIEDRGVVIKGRSDTTLNPGGVRIGTAEIYQQLEKLKKVEDAVVVGIPFEGDIKVILCVQLLQNLTKELENEIRQFIKEQLTPRHVPWLILQVKGIPYTRSGKKMEKAVLKMLAMGNSEQVASMQNPEVVTEYVGYQAKVEAYLRQERT